MVPSGRRGSGPRACSCAEISTSHHLPWQAGPVHAKRLAWERILPVSILCITAAVVPYWVWSDNGLPKLGRLRADRDAVRDKSSRLELEIRQMQAEVERIKSDPRAVERAARDELGLVRQTEVVFQFQR